MFAIQAWWEDWTLWWRWRWNDGGIMWLINNIAKDHPGSLDRIGCGVHDSFVQLGTDGCQLGRSRGFILSSSVRERYR